MSIRDKRMNRKESGKWRLKTKVEMRLDVAVTTLTTG